ncbi:phloem protein 2-A10 [Hibiscus trionum]|uniref:Phloem protein 2-A10 n=1 Tax=Hibiscus trionum TaxID=183268 RepID=A0A9W7MCK2_HIBTR|nr:phloem protein 2-A10 [Hibiscus trionum]
MSSKPHHEADINYIDSKTDVNTNKIAVTFKPRGLNIVWGNDGRYWRFPNLPSSSATPSGEEEPVELVQVSWLEVTGSCPLRDSTKYQITFKLSFTRDAFGWSGAPVFLMAKVGKKGKYKWKKLKDLDKLPKTPTDFPSKEDSFIVESGPWQPDMRLYFGLYEVWSGKWKGGLKVHQATVQEINS